MVRIAGANSSEVNDCGAEAEAPRNPPAIAKAQAVIQAAGAEAPEFEKLYKYDYVTFQLSNELLDGLDGQRGDDHKVEYRTFVLCLDKLAKKRLIRNIDKLQTEYGIVAHFNDLNRGILRFVMDHHKQPIDEKKKVILKTAFYPSQSNLRQGLTEAKFQQFVKELTEIDSTSPPAATNP